MVKNTAFDYINLTALFALLAVFILPVLHIFSISLSDGSAILRGQVRFWPVGLQLDAYTIILRNAVIWQGYRNSIVYSGTGTALTMLLCSLPAYVLTTKEFKAKKLFTAYFAITMFFNGGIIPLFLVIRSLGLLDSIWAIVLPPALSAWTIILYRTNFKQIPDSLIEAAKMDGASHGWIYIQVVLPLSKAIIAVLSLFAFVGYWNTYFPALMYLTSQDKQPLMIVLRKYVVEGNLRGNMEHLIASMGKVYDPMGLERSLKMATIFVSILPIILIYPFIQKHLAKGILVGSIKE